MLKVFDQLYRSIHGLPVGHDLPIEDTPRVQFLFGGYVWQDGEFKIWYIDLDRPSKSFRFRRAGRCYFIGDAAAVSEARKRTMRLLNERNRSLSSIDMEPFEILRDIVREKKHPHIGGAPQIAKVYRHMNTQFFSTLWTDQENKRSPHVFGRPLLENETSAWPVFDPDTLRFATQSPENKNAKEVAEHKDEENDNAQE